MECWDLPATSSWQRWSSRCPLFSSSRSLLSESLVGRSRTIKHRLGLKLFYFWLFSPICSSRLRNAWQSGGSRIKSSVCFFIWRIGFHPSYSHFAGLFLPLDDLMWPVLEGFLLHHTIQLLRPKHVLSSFQWRNFWILRQRIELNESSRARLR